LANREGGYPQDYPWFGEAWNARDMKVPAGSFREDDACVNIVGMPWHGRAEIESADIGLHATTFTCRI
jgi:hypothetical protein